MTIVKQDQLKTAQVVARLLKSRGGKMPLSELLELLVSADKRAIELIGDPMGGVCSAEPGETPLARDTQLMLSGEEYPFWSPFIRQIGEEIEVIRDPGDGHLSEFDENVLDSVV